MSKGPHNTQCIKAWSFIFPRCLWLFSAPLLSSPIENLGIFFAKVCNWQELWAHWCLQAFFDYVSKSMKMLTLSVQLLLEQFLRDCCDFPGWCLVWFLWFSFFCSLRDFKWYFLISQLRLGFFQWITPSFYTLIFIQILAIVRGAFAVHDLKNLFGIHLIPDLLAFGTQLDFRPHPSLLMSMP